MVNKDLIRFEHMLDSASAILTFVEGKKRAQFDTDRMLASSVVRELEILGEAAGKISQKTRNIYRHLPWQEMIGMRNQLIHAYFDVDYDIVWTTVKEDLPTMCVHLKEIIAELKS